MNERLRKVMEARYKAVIEDCKYKIRCYSDQEIIIPEHPDITAEIDTLLIKMAEAEDKLAVMELHYGKNGQSRYYRDLESFKNIFLKSSKKKCTFVLLV